MKKIIYSCLFLALALFTFNSCSSDSDEVVRETPKSSDKDIFSFTFIWDGVELPVNFDDTSLSIVFPALSDVTKLVPTIDVSDKATIEPKSGVAQDFTNPVTYTVTAEDGSKKEYVVTVSLLDPGTDTRIFVFGFKNLAEGQASYRTYDRDSTDIDSLVYSVPYLSPIKELISDIYIDDYATIVPASGETLDYTEPVKYTVTAQNGDTQEYLIFIENDLDDVKVQGFTIDSFRDKKPGDIISFNVNEINPILDSIKVSLVDRLTQTKIALEVQDAIEIDSWTNTITAKLPDTYANNGYQLEVSIEHDNTDMSDGFRLDKGTPNFVRVNPYFNNSEYLTQKTLISPNGNFNAKMYLETARFDDYKFYLKQNGAEYSLTATGMDDYFGEVFFSMPSNLEFQGGTTGTDYEIVIEIDGVKNSFPLLNDLNEAVEVIAAANPYVSSFDKVNYIKGETITVFGGDLYYDTEFSGDLTPTLVSKLTLEHPFNSALNRTLEATSDSSNEITFTIPTDIQSSAYRLSFENNVISYYHETYIDINVKQPASEHPTLDITEAVLYNNSTELLYKQVRLSFNGNVDTVNIENFLLDIDNLEVGSYFVNPTSVLTGQLSDTNIGRILDYKDGSITIDGYKIPFTLEIRN